MIKKVSNIAFYVIAIFYVFLMLDLFFRINVISSSSEILRSYNLIPFKTIWDYTSGNIYVSKSLVRHNILGNIVVFIPYGLYLQVLLKNKVFGKSLLIVFTTSISIEIIQFVFGLGAADIDDVILNVCGGITGIIGYKVLLKLFREVSRTKTAITVISLVIGIPIMFIYFMVCIHRYF
ncbi:MAG TPA: teicoplanin resistance protein VanZ [Lachnoclostridium sp.]|jgi:glycopeptide antibiotics resistance protein|uniref:VanZ family protein n=1 Tax=Lacrimispora sp. TaxID=2719234 RepID=UPI000EE72112|nr:teicoplanin resistance protein VanZ [Lachnoclostridium sp.]